MWTFHPDCMFSAVKKDCKADELLVRARRPGDLEKVFPKAKVTEYDKSDYQFRAVMKFDYYVECMVGEFKRICYSNFKNSVRDPALHRAYERVWSIMAELQPKAPYSGYGRGKLDSAFFDDFGAELLPKKKQQQFAFVAKVAKKKAGKLTRGQ